ncbi:MULTISPECIES: flavodoxin family protein [Clostridium]|uniref:flavodoxin family protein n=1 Tax=Clostridium TaxID=1485 RepID=UPI0005ED8ABA|nr:MULTISPECIES: flavodoxin [Clostridium]MBW5459256.1 flavodoxin [Clostridium sporogenes]MDU7252954.1 flavodoxin [Clostridium sp.]
MKSLIVFYSLEGHTKFIADIIREELDCNLLQLKPEKEITKRGIGKFFFGGKSAIFNEKPSLKNQIPNLNEYDTIFIGTPIWAGRYTPAINTFVSENKIKEKNVAFFACHGGGGAKKCFDKLEQVLNDNTILGTIDFVDSQDEIEKREKVKQWLSSIKISR